MPDTPPVTGKTAFSNSQPPVSPSDRAVHFREPVGRRALATLVLWYERLGPALWQAAACIGLFVAVAFFDILPGIGGWWHALALVLFVAGTVFLARRGLKRLHAPTIRESRRRLEEDSGLEHRPLTTLMDQPAIADGATGDLWRRHVERTLAAIGRWRVGPPRVFLATYDKFAVRAGVLLLLGVSVVAGWGEWGPRFQRALTPAFAAGPAPLPPNLDLFITPPDYTGLPPLYVQAQGTPAEGDGAAMAAPETLSVPYGSVLLARVTGGQAVPELVLDDAETALAFDPVAEGQFAFETELTEGASLSIRQGELDLGQWPIAIVADNPPEIDFDEDPSATPHGALRLGYEASDDYGIMEVSAVIELADGAAEALARSEMRIPLPVPGHRPRDAASTLFEDLTPHPWAGQPVKVRLEATDDPGAVGTSAIIEMILPEREFTHPVARAIVEQRRQLLIDPQANYEIVAETLATLASRPDRFYDDRVVFLALRTVARRLMLTKPLDQAVGPVAETLWETALRIEDGEVSLAENALRDAQQALMEALADNSATDEEIRQLIEELREAMNEYLNAMRDQLAEQMARGEMPEMAPMPPDAQMVDRDMLEDLMDQLSDLNESGARDAARELLSQLQQMMENLQAGQPMMMPSDPSQQAMNDLLQSLEDLARAQQELLDQTMRNSQQGQEGQQGQPGQQQQPGQPGQQGQQGQPGQGGMSPGEGAGIQEALRRALGELMREMGDMSGEIPSPLGRAEQAMRQSQDALSQGDPGQSLGPQTEALDQLQQGLEQFVEQMMEGQNNQSAGGPSQGPLGRMRPDGRDPLGRERTNNGGVVGGDVELPSQPDIQRSRQILDELRRRAGESTRPPVERDYIDRLLRRF